MLKFSTYHGGARRQGRVRRTHAPPAGGRRSLTAARAVISPMTGQFRPNHFGEVPMTTSHNEPDGTPRITAHLIAEDARLEALPRHFGLHMLRLEDTVFDFMRQFATGYVGGFWDMLE